MNETPEPSVREPSVWVRIVRGTIHAAFTASLVVLATNGCHAPTISMPSFGCSPRPSPEPSPVPPPTPLTSFRVILVYESADNLTTSQRASMTGKVVEEWLNANCTGGRDGWRRRDKDAPGENDPSLAAIWKAVQPNLTATPCVVVERNGVVKIVGVGSSPAATVESLRQIREGK